MSFKQNEQIEEMLYENGFCTKCMQKITKELKDDGTTQGEYEIEKGHLEDCTYFETSDRQASEIKAEKAKDFDLNTYVKNKKVSPSKFETAFYTTGEVSERRVK